MEIRKDPIKILYFIVSVQCIPGEGILLLWIKSYSIMDKLSLIYGMQLHNHGPKLQQGSF